MLQNNQNCFVAGCGTIPYLVAWEKQRALMNAKIKDPSLPDILLLLGATCLA